MTNKFDYIKTAENIALQETESIVEIKGILRTEFYIEGPNKNSVE